jgi:type I restriction enzyme S subunit
MKWQTKTLGDVLSVLSNGGNFLQDKSGNGERVTRIETIAQAQIDLNRVGYSRLTEAEKKKYKLRRGDILFSHINSVIHVGKTAIVDNDEELYQGINLLLMRPNEQVSPVYLQYFLKLLFQSGYWLQVCKQSVNQASVNQQDIKKIPIAFPDSLPEQKRIVKILDEVFAHAVQAKENAEKNLANAKALFESALLKIFTDGINTKKWELEKLEKYNKVVVGYVGPISQAYTDDEDGTLLLSTKNISDDGISLEKLTRINHKFHEKNIKSQLVPGDILVARHGKSGQAAVVNNDIKTAHALNVIIIKRSDTLSSEYISFLLNSGVLHKISSSKTGSIQEIINTSIIKDLIIPVPSLIEQRAIVRKLNTLSADTKKLEAIYTQKLAALEELKKSVLKQAFEGRL